MTVALTLGFVPLTDAAPLIVAHELGFAEEEGLHLTLVRENTWSSVRDKLAYGVFDAAHLLAPMSIAMTLGLGPVRGRIDVPFVLNMNGNAFVAGWPLAEKLTGAGARFGDARSFGQALLACSGDGPIRVGVPFMTSMHVCMLRYLVTSLGGKASDVFDFVVCPPPMIEDVLISGKIDAFMVGAPWGNQAVENNVGKLMLTGNSIWQAAPEKVLALRHDWLEENRDEAQKLVRALYRASLWAMRKGNHTTLSEILSRARYLNVAGDILDQMIRGRIALDGSGAIAVQPNSLRFGGTAVSFPWKSAAAWIAEQEAPYWGIPIPLARSAARDAFRSDVYRSALSPINAPLPLASEKLEGMFAQPTQVSASRELTLGPDAFFDGTIYDPA
jgi:ABC-type nitrate/sulfonate/bicarbonate transport system substrate-binding protein